MNKPLLIEAAALYLPLSACLFYGLILRPPKRIWVAALMAFTWQLSILPWINYAAVKLHWWTFHETPAQFLGMPVTLYLGWAFFWGVLMIFLQESSWGQKWRASLPFTTLLCLLLDLLLMPLMSPVLVLGEKWLVGEILLLLVALLPAQLMARGKVQDIWLTYRAVLISFSFILLLLTISPLLASPDALDHAMEAVSDRPRLQNSFFTVLLLLAAIPGFSALQEFIRKGKGTPIPFDPPRELVTTGVYAYCANPMQVSMFLVLLIWGIIFQNWVCPALAGVSFIYSLGIARWSEGEDMKQRFGEAWGAYKKEVPSWRFRLSSDYPQAQLYIARDCGICSELRRWLEKQDATGLVFKHAEDFPDTPLTRITYTAENVRVSGVVAVAEAFQHLNIRFAFLGWFMRLPLVSLLLQCALDVSGAGKMVRCEHKE